MKNGRQVESARFQALVLRLIVAFLVFASTVMDCLDGMHARRTGQCSRLGEVLDHALDAANIPLIGAGFIAILSLDKYTLAISMVACGLVFNSQLVLYRAYHTMIKPATNGPESQTLVVVAEIVVSIVFYLYSRHHPIIEAIVAVVAVIANVIQFRNCYHFWRHLDRNTVFDHLKFSVMASAFALLFVTDRISFLTFNMGSVLIAFRLNGAYVMYVVVNKFRRQLLQASATATSKPDFVVPEKDFDSIFTSLFSGMDYSILAWIIIFALAPLISRPMAVSSTATLTHILPVFSLEYPLLAAFAIHVLLMTVVDLKQCLPYLVPWAMQKAPFIRLFI